LQETTTVSKSSDGPQAKRFDYTGIIDVTIGVVVFILAWQIVFDLKFYPSFLLPSPVMVLNELVLLARSGMLQNSLYTTGYRLIAGFCIAIVLGVLVGLVMVTFKRFGRTMSSFALGLQSFPSIAWVPFAILVIGLTDWGVIFVIVISSVFSIMLSTYSAIRNIPPIYMKAAKNMGSRRLSLYTHVILPAAMPSFVVGLKQSWSFSWHALISAEILMTTVGIGAILELGGQFARMDEIIAAMIVIFVIGLLIDRIFFFKLEQSIRSKRGLAL
jgi:NitT/TauT family transport system permease protein